MNCSDKILLSVSQRINICGRMLFSRSDVPKCVSSLQLIHNTLLHFNNNGKIKIKKGKYSVLTCEISPKRANNSSKSDSVHENGKFLRNSREVFKIVSLGEFSVAISEDTVLFDSWNGIVNSARQCSQCMTYCVANIWLQSHIIILILFKNPFGCFWRWNFCHPTFHPLYIVQIIFRYVVLFYRL